MMVALLLYAYATKQRSSRANERHCGRYEWMRKLLATELGERLYQKTLTDGRADVRAHQAQPWGWAAFTDAAGPPPAPNGA